MDNKEIASMTGQQGGERVVAHKLNEIRMSGDDGKFTYLELLGEKGADGKYAFLRKLEGANSFTALFWWHVKPKLDGSRRAK